VEQDAPEAESLCRRGAGAGETLSMDEPLVAHVRDLATGEIGLFSGTREIVLPRPLPGCPAVPRHPLSAARPSALEAIDHSE